MRRPTARTRFADGDSCATTGRPHVAWPNRSVHHSRRGWTDRRTDAVLERSKARCPAVRSERPRGSFSHRGLKRTPRCTSTSRCTPPDHTERTCGAAPKPPGP